MKTLFLYEVTTQKARFFEIDEDYDYSHLDDVFINSSNCDIKLQQELSDLLFYEDGDYKVTFLDKPTKNWDAFVRVGFLE